MLRKLQPFSYPLHWYLEEFETCTEKEKDFHEQFDELSNAVPVELIRLFPDMRLAFRFLLYDKHFQAP